MKERISLAERTTFLLRQTLSYSCGIISGTSGAILALGVLLPSNALAESVTRNTAGTTTWECPPGITRVTVECWGGGGAGGAANNTTTATTGTINVAGGGGAGGAYARKVNVPVTPGFSYDLTIPAAAVGAPAGSADGVQGDTGGTVTFTGDSSVVVTAVGGQGGASMVASTTSSGAGGTGSTTGCDGDVVFAGGSCNVGAASGTAGGGGGGAGDSNPGGNTSNNVGGAGGLNGGGVGGTGPTGGNNGNAGGAPGVAGGGSGGRQQRTTTSGPKAGGAGGLGQITITFSPPSTGKLVVTAVPANAIAGTDFSVTVQSQTSGGAPLNVTQDTDILLTASGSGTITGNTATILSGQNTATFNFVQYKKPDSITLTASRTSGDGLDASVPSPSITINVGPASQLVVETAADGTGVPVAAQTVYPGNSLTAHAISRDSVGNFIANETATWTLANITGDIVSGDLLDNANGSATFTADGLGTANIRATFAGLPDADSGLITVDKFYHRWTGAGANGSWETTGNWTDSVLPAFNNTTDLYFSAPSNTKSFPYIGNNKSVRSINFDTTSTASLTISYVKAGNTLPANLTLDTDSTSEPAEINVDAAFTGNATLGYYATTEAGRGIMILNDDLLVTHNGTGLLILNGDITASGSQGISKAGTGTLVISGTNSYTGDTIVNGGILAVNGSSIADTNTLVIDGGKVDVTGNETVAKLFFGATPKADGVYGSTSSSAPPANQDDTRFSGTGTVTVDSSLAPGGFTAWIAAGGFANDALLVGNDGPNDDPDNDGISNLIEYALDGCDPTASNAAPGSISGLLVTYTKRALAVSNDDVTYSIEESADLGLSDFWATATPTTDNDSIITYTLTPPAPSKDFVRLKVTQP